MLVTADGVKTVRNQTGEVYVALFLLLLGQLMNE